MTPTVIVLVLFAAILHATWNAVLRRGADHLWAVTIMSYASTVAALPFATYLPLPRAECYPYLVASAVLQVGYSVFLAFAYRDGALGQVYPIIRGSVPLLVTIGGLLFADQQLRLASTLGVALVSVGIMGMAFGRNRAAPKTIVLALCTGLFIASYVTTDGIGVRLSGDARSYVAWILTIYGVLMPVMFRLLRGRFAAGLRTPEGTKSIASGLISLISYAAVISALALGPLGPISALRETSIVFSVAIGRLVLREPVTGQSVLACATVAIGAVLIGYTS